MTSTFQPASWTASESGWPGKEAEATVTRRLGICTSWCGSNRIHGSACRVGTSTSICPYRHGRRFSGRQSSSTPGGEAKVKVVPGSSTGRKLRLRGEGMPNPRGANGNLYAEIKVMVPPKPTARERELFEQLGAESNFNPRKET